MDKSNDAGIVEGLVISFCFGGKAVGQVIKREVTELRARFDYENVSGVERALIDCIVLCWMRLQKCELDRAGLELEGARRAPAEYIERAERHLHRAHARYLRSIEKLAKVQFLMSRTHQGRLAAARAALAGEGSRQGPGKVLEMRAG